MNYTISKFMDKMTRGIIISLLAFMTCICGPFAPAHSQEQQLPQRIMLNPVESGNTGVAVTWRIEGEVSGQSVQWKLADAHPVRDMANIQEVKAVKQVDTVEFDNQTAIFQSFRTRLSGLKPGMTYMYRVGNEETGWSEWIQFDLPPEDPHEPVTFIYLGDPQNDLRSQWARTIREAYATAPQADFILYAGDLVNKGYNDAEWQEWYDAGGFIHRMLPSVLTPGNHEFTNVILTPLWRSHFTLPENGPAGIDALKGSCYYVDYPGLRVISLDGEQIDEDPQMRLAMVRWLENVLENNPHQWTVMTMHYPFYHTRPDRNNPKLRTAFKPIVDRYGVDLVLQGHDHGYGRGMLDRNGRADEGTMYVVSVSGPKVYDVGHAEWMQVRGENVQLFQVVKVDGDHLNYKSYTTEGELFDEFSLEKADKGSRLIEKQNP